MKFVLITFLSLLAASASAQSSSNLKSVQIDERFQTTILSLGGAASGIEIWWTMTPIQDDLHVCGALKYTGHGKQRISRQVVRDIRFMLSQFEVLKDARFFAEIPRSEKFETARAHCKPTGVNPPRGRFPISIDIPKKRYR